MFQHELPKHFIQSSSSCLLLLDQDLNVVAFNETFAAFTKAIYGASPIIGEEVSNHIHPDHIEAFRSSCQKALNGASQKYERLFKYEDYSIFWQVSYEPVPGPSGEIIGVSFTATDISKTLEHEQTIFLQNQSLKQIAHLQSHQLRKPVSSILGLMNLLKEDGHMEAIPELAIMEQAVLELDDMIHKIVDHAHPTDFVNEGLQKHIVQSIVGTEEKKRLEALLRYNPYNIIFKLSFDDLTAMAMKITGAEISMINVIDEYQQWSVAQQGATLKPMNRNASICQHTILEESELEIMCISEDPRFAHLQEIRAYNMTYYYGVPVRTLDGHAIAALCVFSKTSKKLNEHQKSMMRLLAEQVIIRMDNMRRIEQLELQLAQFQSTEQT